MLGSLLVDLNFKIVHIRSEPGFCAVVLSVMADKYPDFKQFLGVILEIPASPNDQTATLRVALELIMSS
ncbi:MAG: hypothetical protein NTV48_00505 [Candidatus Vogelbacteria bacterium]|nr:hypothetical protein [Candidatus Vogelbacteria bacterium]